MIQVCVGAVEGVVINENSAVGDVRVVVENDSVSLPIVSPIVPTPAKAPEEADAKAEAKGNSWSG
jgi:hypothetical protein